MPDLLLAPLVGLVIVLTGSLVQFPSVESLEPDFAIYHTRSMLLDQVKAIVARHPSFMSMQVKQLKVSDYETELLIVTATSNICEVEFASKLRILLNFGQHGREIITSEVALRILEIFSGDYASNWPEVDEILSKAVFKIVPMENAKGREIVENGSFCERRNGRGVDTNRNWDINWGRKEKDFDPAEEDPGVGPFSEPEAKMMLELTSDFKPHMWVNFHSGMRGLFMPYDHKQMTPSDGSAEVIGLLLQTVNRLHCNSSCTVGSGGSSVGYLAHGTATDYMYDVMKVPVALTFEIYGDANASHNECFRMFNPTTRSLYESVVLNWSLAVLTLVSHLPSTLQSLAKSKLEMHQQRPFRLSELQLQVFSLGTLLLFFILSGQCRRRLAGFRQKWDCQQHRGRP